MSLFSENKKIEELEKELKRLNQELEKTKHEKEQIEKRFEETKKDFENTKKEFEEFKAKHNSTVSQLQKALKIKADKKEKFKPIGAPVGHKGYARHIPERVDYIKAWSLKTCPVCGTKLGNTQEVRSRYLTDIKLTSETKTTRYDIHRKYCTVCKKLVEKPIPNALPHARFGLNLMLLIMYLRLGLRLPCNKICEFLLTIYSLKISEGEIIHVMKQLAREYGDYYAKLEKLLKLARVKYTDSTSWRVNGKNYFAWVFIAAGVVLYKIRKRNNSKVPLTVFGTKQKGNTLVIDRHSALRALAKKAGFYLQLCWAHILADSKELAKNFGSEGKYVHKHLKQVYQLATNIEEGLPEHIDALKAEIFLLTQRHYKSTKIRRFVNNLWNRDRENLFRFVTDKDVASTNNISERELRALVIIRKISNGSRSQRGANATALLLSIVQTLRFKKKNILHGLSEILNSPSGY